MLSHALPTLLTLHLTAVFSSTGVLGTGGSADCILIISEHCVLYSDFVAVKECPHLFFFIEDMTADTEDGSPEGFSPLKAGRPFPLLPHACLVERIAAKQ